MRQVEHAEQTSSETEQELTVDALLALDPEKAREQVLSLSKAQQLALRRENDKAADENFRTLLVSPADHASNGELAAREEAEARQLRHVELDYLLDEVLSTQEELPFGRPKPRSVV